MTRWMKRITNVHIVTNASSFVTNNEKKNSSELSPTYSVIRTHKTQFKSVSYS